MKFKGTIVADLSGSLGGIVASHNRFATYFRTRAIPVNAQTVFQQNVRSEFSALASRWTDVLNDAQRSAWTTYALNVGLNKSALNWYIACNAVRRQLTPAGDTQFAFVDDAPTVFSLAALTPPTITVADGSPASIDVTFTNTDQWATEVGGSLWIQASRQYSPSINFFVGPFQLAARRDGAVVPPVPPFSVASPFDAAIGNKVTCRFIASLADGRISAPSFATAVAA